MQSLTPTKVETEDVIQTDAVVEKVETPIQPNTDDPEIESLDEALIRSQKSRDTSATDSTKSVTTPKKEIVYSKKTMKEIEAEVAQNTAEFDKTALKSTTAKKDDKVVPKRKVEVPSNVQPSSIMRLIRLLIIVAIGVFLGKCNVRSQLILVSLCLLLLLHHHGHHRVSDGDRREEGGAAAYHHRVHDWTCDRVLQCEDAGALCLHRDATLCFCHPIVLSGRCLKSQSINRRRLQNSTSSLQLTVTRTVWQAALNRNNKRHSPTQSTQRRGGHGSDGPPPRRVASLSAQ